MKNGTVGEDGGVTLSRKLRTALAAAGLGWLIVLVVWGPAPLAVSFDDAYYYFTIGRNWANGYASSFDQIGRTNGYHPLWQLISVVPFLLGFDGTGAVRFLLVTQLVLWLGAWWLITGQIIRSVDGWPKLADNPRARRWCDTSVVVIVLALAANPFLFKMVVNGLESGLVVPVGAALLVYTERFQGRFASRASRRQRLATGGLLALAFVSRTDSVLLLAVIGVWCLLDSGAAKNPTPIGRRVRAAIEVLIVPAAFIVVYLVANLSWFGMAMQISGSIKRLPMTPARAGITVVWALIGFAVLLGVRKPISVKSRMLRARRFLSATGWYATFGVALLGYYSTLQEVPYLWYFAPVALYGMWLIILFSADLAEGAVVDAMSKASTTTARPTAMVPILIVAVPLVVACAYSFKSFVDPGTRSIMVHDRRAGEWIDRNLPQNARVASWDAGIIGYFSHRSVTNLDGVVGSKSWLRAVDNNATDAFLADRNVTWVANHGESVKGREPGIDKLLRRYFGDVATQRIVVVYNESYLYTGTLDGSRTDTSTKRLATYVYQIERP